ncbi:L,D-transpeptidase family protein [Sphingomonas sp. RB56-2]|uniref:L,D-transpeptidase family protein n=1 Tax=Sphingomonas brevis TaxID=2908206 RepID=A0ABT0SBM6_9SPHN|nr:L,D-transpeptidase family protein [Sphingomonas brevis]MCL6741743.1 L,D-transpeptidase family protein [Sphingomonas brevis]
MAIVPVALAAQQPVAAPAAPASKPVAQPKPADPIGPLPEGVTEPPQAAPEPPPLPPPPPIWTLQQASALAGYINNVGSEGLSPTDYDPAGLIEAMRSNDPQLLAQAATDRFNKLSSDLALGHVRGDARIDWHVVDKDLDEARQRQMLDAALVTNRIPEVLNSLLPTHPQYGALRTALSITPKTDTQKINKIRLNMDRWRWLPRELGQKYIIVNVPSYYATLVENGATRWKTRAVAGAIKTPTPQLNATAVGVILNPWWEVPPSISKEVAGKPGYVAVKGKDGKVQRWRQPPGPTNALGQLKFVMYNEQNIYLHDTNAKSRFNSEVRAASHGCIRTKDVLDLATMLLGDDGGEWTPDKITETLASKKSKQANFVKPLPIYIVYFSIAANTDGSIVSYEDMYKRDGKVISALLDNDGKAPVDKKPAEKVAAK